LLTVISIVAVPTADAIASTGIRAKPLDYGLLSATSITSLYQNKNL